MCGKRSPILSPSQFFTAIYWSFFSCFSVLTTMPAERSVLIKERSSGAYRLSAYFLARILAGTPLRLAMPSLYIVVVFWTTAWGSSFGTFMAVWAVMLLNCYVFMGVGQFVAATVFDFQTAFVTCVVMLLTFMLVGGFYIAAIPPWIGWVAYLSPISYSWPLMVALVYPAGTSLPCDAGQVNTEQWGACPLTQEGILSGIAARIHEPWGNALVLVLLAIVLRIGAYFALRRNTAYH